MQKLQKLSSSLCNRIRHRLPLFLLQNLRLKGISRDWKLQILYTKQTKRLRYTVT